MGVCLSITGSPPPQSLDMSQRDPVCLVHVEAEPQRVNIPVLLIEIRTKPRTSEADPGALVSPKPSKEKHTCSA